MNRSKNMFLSEWNFSMKCVILVAGHATMLENEIRTEGPRELIGVPKALLPRFSIDSRKKILDSWWNAVNQRSLFSDVYLVTNADKYKVNLNFTAA